MAYLSDARGCWKGTAVGHQDGASSFQSMKRSFPRPTSMVLSAIKVRVVILSSNCGRTMAEVGSGGWFCYACYAFHQGGGDSLYFSCHSVFTSDVKFTSPACCRCAGNLFFEGLEAFDMITPILLFASLESILFDAMVSS